MKLPDEVAVGIACREKIYFLPEFLCSRPERLEISSGKKYRSEIRGNRDPASLVAAQEFGKINRFFVHIPRVYQMLELFAYDGR